MNLHIFKTIGIGVAFSPNLKANIYEAARVAVFFELKLVLIHVIAASEEKSDSIKSHLAPFMDRELDYETLFQPGEPAGVILQAIEHNHIESNGHSLFLFGKEGKDGVKEIKALLYFGKRLRK